MSITIYYPDNSFEVFSELWKIRHSLIRYVSGVSDRLHFDHRNRCAIFAIADCIYDLCRYMSESGTSEIFNFFGFEIKNNEPSLIISEVDSLLKEFDHEGNDE